MSSESFNFIIIPAIDLEGEARQARNAKYLVSSLFRSLFSGKILVIRNTPTTLFKVFRTGLEEVYYESQRICKTEADRRSVENEVLLNLAEWVESESSEWVAIVQPATLILRNVDHLFPINRVDFPKCADLLWMEGRNVGALYRASPGFFAVRTQHVLEVVGAWAAFRKSENEIDAWNGFLDQLTLRKSRFEYGETYWSLGTQLDWSCLSKSALVHFSDLSIAEESSLIRSVYLGICMGDEMTILLHLMEH